MPESRALPSDDLAATFLPISNRWTHLDPPDRALAETPELGALPADDLTASSLPPPQRWIEVDLSEQRLQAHEGNLAHVFRVSTGDADHPTIIGHYNIYVKYERSDLIGRDFYRRDVPYVMMFYPSFALHAATWHDDFGTPVSRGCVNLRLEDAAWLFDWADIGTLVFIHY